MKDGPDVYKQTGGQLIGGEQANESYNHLRNLEHMRANYQRMIDKIDQQIRLMNQNPVIAEFLSLQN